MAGLGTSTMSNLLKRNNMPSLPSLIKICVVLGIKVSSFFRELEFESPELFLVSEGEVQRFDPLLNRKNQIIEHFSSLPIQDKSEVMEKIRKNYPVDSNDKTKE
jgi:transcriptional regulator with XRE-family HTH domain